jgi:SAM-dependent methyltransferase
MQAKRYDAAYFDKWYRDPRHRVKSPAELDRQVRFTLSTAEFLLDQAVRSVLDVGSGEGQWNPALRKLRPAIRYVGVDPSEYAVSRFGERRNLRLGRIGELESLALPGPFDLIVCCGVLNYLDARTLKRGVRELAELSNGMLYLELFTAEDRIEGDTTWPAPRPAAWYRRVMRDAGLVPCGMQCYLPESLAEQASALERG